MSICIRNGVRYNRHAWKKQSALADVTACEYCGQIKGGVFEQRDSEGTIEGVGGTIPNRDLSEVLRADGGMQLSGDNGDTGANQGLVAAT